MGLEWWLSTTCQATKSFGTCLHFRLCVDTSPEGAVQGQPTQTVSWHVLAEYGWVLPKILKATRWGQGWWLLILSPFFLHVFSFCLRPMWCPCLQPWACQWTGHARWRRGQPHQSWGYLCSRESYVWHLAKLSFGSWLYHSMLDPPVWKTQFSTFSFEAACDASRWRRWLVKFAPVHDMTGNSWLKGSFMDIHGHFDIMLGFAPRTAGLFCSRKIMYEFNWIYMISFSMLKHFQSCDVLCFLLAVSTEPKVLLLYAKSSKSKIWRRSM